MNKLIKELINTFSNKPSFLSSKRIERFSVFTLMLLATTTWLCMGIFKCNLSATDLVLVVSVWLGYAGFNTVQIKKDNKDESN
jgi:tryptophan-rich sensory protein